MCPLIWERELAGVQVSRLQSQVFLLGVGVVRARRGNVTPARVHDSVVLSEMIGKGDNGQSLHADSAYKSHECDVMLCTKAVF